MKQASFILGIIAIIGMLIGFIPCLGWFNWLNLPIAIVGIVLGIIAYNEQQQNYNNQYGPVQRETPMGLILCCIAFVFGVFRLVIGFGVI
mgnify:CR=1 FL=1